VQTSIFALVLLGMLCGVVVLICSTAAFVRALLVFQRSWPQPAHLWEDAFFKQCAVIAAIGLTVVAAMACFGFILTVFQGHI